MGSGGGASSFFVRRDGKPEAYRSVLRQSRSADEGVRAPSREDADETSALPAKEEADEGVRAPGREEADEMSALPVKEEADDTFALPVEIMLALRARCGQEARAPIPSAFPAQN